MYLIEKEGAMALSFFILWQGQISYNGNGDLGVSP